MTQDEKLHKEIDLIQNCITRMANNSFLIKGWLLSIFAVVIALLAEEIRIYNLAAALIVPTLSFWYLDAFFLQAEKKYRLLYKWVIKKRLKTDKHLYNLNPKRFANEAGSVPSVMFSKTLIVFYGLPYLGIIVLFIVDYWFK